MRAYRTRFCRVQCHDPWPCTDPVGLIRRCRARAAEVHSRRRIALSRNFDFRRDVAGRGFCSSGGASARAQRSSALDIAGQDKANPVSLILSSVMLLDWLAWRHEAENFARAAAVIKRGVDGMLARPETRMRDLGCKLGTKIFINHNHPPPAVADKLQGLIAAGCEIYRDAPRPTNASNLNVKIAAVGKTWTIRDAMTASAPAISRKMRIWCRLSDPDHLWASVRPATFAASPFAEPCLRAFQTMSGETRIEVAIMTMTTSTAA